MLSHFNDCLVPQNDEQSPGRIPVTPEDFKPTEPRTADRNFSSGWIVGVRYKIGYNLPQGGIAEFDGTCTAIYDSYLTLSDHSRHLTLFYDRIYRRRKFARWEIIWEDV